MDSGTIQRPRHLFATLFNLILVRIDACNRGAALASFRCCCSGAQCGWLPFSSGYWTIDMVGFGPPASTLCRSAVHAPEGEDGGPDPGRDGSPRQDDRVVVALIDDRALFGESLAMAMNIQDAGFRATHWTGADAMANLPSALGGADVVLVCLGRATLTRSTTNQLIKALLGVSGHPPIAVLADTISVASVKAGIAMGLRGFMTSDAPLGAVMDALRKIRQGATVIPSAH